MAIADEESCAICYHECAAHTARTVYCDSCGRPDTEVSCVTCRVIERYRMLSCSACGALLCADCKVEHMRQHVPVKSRR